LQEIFSWKVLLSHKEKKPDFVNLFKITGTLGCGGTLKASGLTYPVGPKTEQGREQTERQDQVGLWSLPGFFPLLKMEVTASVWVPPQ
jgi:hypothetical protein